LGKTAVLALLVSALAAGCGGGPDETTEVKTIAPQPQSRADYVERADAICHNHQSRREDLVSQASDLGPLTSKAKAHRVAGLLREESSNRRAEVSELGDLPPPAADAAQVNEILELVRTEADVIDTWAAAYDELDAAAIRRQQIRLGLTAGRAAARARAYGVEVCGQQ
jgi:hypothetical protein